MADVQSSPVPAGTPPTPVATGDENRFMAIVVYGLNIAALVSCGIAGIAGVIVAYIKKGEARGTIWESHFDNQISAFWGWFALCVIGVLTFWVFFLGFLVIGIAFVWFLYRTIKGLVLALENKPYA